MKPGFAALLALLTVLSGCDSLGDGNTIRKLEIVPASGSTQRVPYEEGGTFTLFQCLRNELVLLATFTNGTVANFSYRATWASSDDSIVAVSNGDIPAKFVSLEDGTFYDHATIEYAPGTVIPKGVPGDEAVVTARFAGLSASMKVRIHKPTLRIVPVPNDAPATVFDPVYLGEGTKQRLAILGNLDGRTVTESELTLGSQNGFTINQFRWVFPDGTFEAADPDVSNDFPKWVIEPGTDRIATLSTLGVVAGHNADYLPYEVMAEQSLCEGAPDVALRPVSHVQVASFVATDDRLTLSREAGFQVSGFELRDLVNGSGHQMQLRGKLDANGDGSLLVEQNLIAQAAYQVLPLNTVCEVEDDLLGCSFNSDLRATNGLVSANFDPDEGDTGRVHACFPFCLEPKASLSSDAPYPVASNVSVTFTADAINPPGGVTINYLFDFGDGTTAGPQASASASHAYAADGTYTATVRLVDAAFPADFLSQNAGAVRVLVGAEAPPANTAPTAAVVPSLNSGAAPVSIRLSGDTSTDANTGDSVTVYEFDPGDGSPVVRQSRPTLFHVYATSGTFTPTLKVYDESGLASATASGSAITITGTAPAFIRSNVLDFRLRDATLCSVEILPPLASAPTEEAFSFPGALFSAVGSFVANTDTDTCDDPEIGKQLVTRAMTWILRPAGDTETVSDIADVRRLSADDFRAAGQVRYFRDVTESTVLDVTATVNAPFPDTIVPTASQLTVTPCTGCTP